MQTRKTPDIDTFHAMHFRPVSPYYTSRKRCKTIDFLTFLGVIEREHWSEIVLIIKLVKFFFSLEGSSFIIWYEDIASYRENATKT